MTVALATPSIWQSFLHHSVEWEWVLSLNFFLLSGRGWLVTPVTPCIRQWIKWPTVVFIWPTSTFDMVTHLASARQPGSPVCPWAVVNNFIFSRVSYCSSLLARTPRYQIDHLQSVLSTSVPLLKRLLVSAKAWPHQTCSAGSPPLASGSAERSVQLCLLMFNALNRLAPSPIYVNQLCQLAADRGCNPRHQLRCHKLRCPLICCSGP